MAQRTYLIRHSANGSEDLFEAKNSLPFFWLTLIKEKDLELRIAEIKKAYQLWDDEEANEQYHTNDPTLTDIVVSKADALNNARSVLPFIRSHFPRSINLFNDLISYLDKRLATTDLIRLNIIALAAYSDIDSFIQSVSDQLSAIRNNEAEKVSGYFNDDVRLGLVGYDDDLGKGFEQYSTAYKDAIAKPVQHDHQQIVQKIQLDTTQIKSRRNKAFLLLIISIVFIFFGVVGFKKEGISIAVPSCFIIGIALIWIAIRKLTNTSRQVR